MEDQADVGGCSTAKTSRRQKTVWQAKQKEVLLSVFAKTPYPSFRTRQELAREFGVPESSIRVWFQNRRNRTGMSRKTSKQTTAGSSHEASQQPPEKLVARVQQARGPPSERRRPRTRLSPAQISMLVQAFEISPSPDYATRVQLALSTGLPEDTVHIWFQNRKARQKGRAGGSTAKGEDLPASPGPERAPGASCCIEQEASRDSLLTSGSAGGQCAEALMSRPELTFFTEAYPESSNSCPVQLFLEQLVRTVEEEQGPAALDPDVPWEQIEPTLEAPLTEEEYQALLDDI
ncbi:homeobox protein [Echinococcus multilocularis]|uniref:Homeobox protein n=1 Tax=Echinococcus multilocularis TaxID=6211 RepID=A0A068XZB9_ECHMU|nr:homeobox protein [Echinococcus multilocularis]